jgi:ribonuclease Z
MGQLERRFGRDDAERRILGLRAVWISHMHADHHGGLYPLLLRRQALQQRQAAERAGGHDGGAAAAGERQPQQPLLVMGPFPLFRVLCTYSKVLPLQFTFLPTSHFYAPGPRPPPPAALAAYEVVKAAAGLSQLLPFPVQHVAHSTGLVVQGDAGWKVVFSGARARGWRAAAAGMLCWAACAT